MPSQCTPAKLAARAVRPSRRTGGFTLVEVLTVIGVIVILVGILTPLVANVRQMASQATCAGNLRQWGIAVNIYAQEYDDFLPRRGQGKMPTQTLTWYDDWFNELAPYLKLKGYGALVAAGRMPQVGDHSVWICPELVGPANAYGNLFGYAMNMALSVRNVALPDRITHIGLPSTMVFMADGPPGYCSTVPYVSTSAASALFNPAPRHQGRVNIVFLDGHVAAFDGSYIGCNTLGDPIHPDACNQPDVRWYWYVPGPSPSPWTGP